jgi:hypothetical protein
MRNSLVYSVCPGLGIEFWFRCCNVQSQAQLPLANIYVQEVKWENQLTETWFVIGFEIVNANFLVFAESVFVLSNKSKKLYMKMYIYVSRLICSQFSRLIS